MPTSCTAWSVQPSPDPSATINVLQGVAAVSSSDAWAVGDYHFLPLILHWNGSTWTQVTSSLTSGTSVLNAVSARSAASAWAVGETYNTTAGAYQALILHRNGTAWTQQPTGAPSSGTSYLQGVKATSARNAWAVGYTLTSAGRQSLILHWNGSTWTQVPSPGPSSSWTVLSAVTATSTTSAWAVGDYYTSGTGYTLIEHWNGTAWTQVPSPDPGGASGTNVLTGVAARDSNAGAVGYYSNASAEQPLAVHL
jgi:hypothetical protein